MVDNALHWMAYHSVIFAIACVGVHFMIRHDPEFNVCPWVDPKRQPVLAWQMWMVFAVRRLQAMPVKERRLRMGCFAVFVVFVIIGMEVI